MKRTVNNNMSNIKIPDRQLLKAELAEIKVPQGKFRRYIVAEGSRV